MANDDEAVLLQDYDPSWADAFLERRQFKHRTAQRNMVEQSSRDGYPDLGPIG
jgi:hypothetical protein